MEIWLQEIKADFGQKKSESARVNMERFRRWGGASGQREPGRDLQSTRGVSLLSMPR